MKRIYNKMKPIIRPFNMLRTITYCKPLYGIRPNRNELTYKKQAFKPVISKVETVVPKIDKKIGSLTVLSIDKFFDSLWGNGKSLIGFSEIFFTEKWAYHDYIFGPILITIDLIMTISIAIIVFGVSIACIFGLVMLALFVVCMIKVIIFRIYVLL